MYSLRLRDEYSHFTDKFSDMEIPPATMRTPSTIAYNQPVPQSELFGPGVRTYECQGAYEHGVRGRQEDRSDPGADNHEEIRGYFGIEGGRIQDVKAWIEKNQGQ